jgi:hypothetical protein
LRKPLLVSCYRFKITDCKLRIPTGNSKFEKIPPTKYSQGILSDPQNKVNSSTLAEKNLSSCVSKEVAEVCELAGAVGIDRDVRNLIAGHSSTIAYYETSKVLEIGETTKDIAKSSKRNDVRVRKEIVSKCGKRKVERVKRIPYVVLEKYR